MALNQESTHFVLCPKQGMYFRIFVLRGIRVSKSQRLNYNESTPPPPPQKKENGKEGLKTGKEKTTMDKKRVVKKKIS